MSEIQEKFTKRKRELLTLHDMTDKVKAYLKKNKATLLKRKHEDEAKISSIRKSHKTGLESRSLSSLSGMD